MCYRRHAAGMARRSGFPAGRPGQVVMMNVPSPFLLVESSTAAARLDAAADFLRHRPALQPVTIVGATRAAADDLARRIALERPATFGLTRLSLTQLAARTAMVALAGERLTPSTWLGAEAVATRAAFTAGRDAALRYFTPVDRKSTRLNSSHLRLSRMPSSA